VLYAFAYSEKQAWLTFCRRIANEHGVRLGDVMSVFDGSKENFAIEKEEILGTNAGT